MTTLPDLPVIRKKREASITPQVLTWFRKAQIGSCAIEIKATDTNTIPEAKLAPHQRLALLDATREGIVHKIADSQRRNPFDAFKIAQATAYVVACFTKRGVCYVIPVEKWKGAYYGKTPNGWEYTIKI